MRFLFLNLEEHPHFALLTRLERSIDRRTGRGQFRTGFRLQLPQLLGDLVCFLIATNIAEGRTGNDQRCAGFVDENVVDFVDDRVVELALHLAVVRVEALVVPASRLHVVAQIIEAELAIGAIGDVALIGLATIARVHVGLDVAGRDANRLIDGKHPFAVAAGKIIVDGDDVHAIAGESVQVRGKRGDERLAFAGHHFRDIIAVQRDATDDLHIVVAHVLGALGGFAAGGKRFRQDVVECFPLGEPFLELGRHFFEFRVGLRLHGRFEFIDAGEHRTGNNRVRRLGILGGDEAQFANEALVARAENAGHGFHDRIGDIGEFLPDLLKDAHFELFGSHRGSVLSIAGTRPRQKSKEKQHSV